MTRLVVALMLVAASPALSPAQQCGPQAVSFAWTQPPLVPIQNENAVRWPRDATLRLAYGGPWCPTDGQVVLLDEEGNPVPAQIRMRTPVNLVDNAPQPLTVVEIDPVEPLAERADYTLIARPDNPSLQSFAEYTLHLRTKGRLMEPVPDFEGVKTAELDGCRCGGETGPFKALDNTNPACLVSSRLRLRITFQPLDRPDLSYAVYRTRSVPLDEAGAEDPASPDAHADPVLVSIQPGTRDLAGTGVPERIVQVATLYYPLPRRECYAVVVLDAWGRERGALDNELCVDLLPLPPCPQQAAPTCPAGCDPEQQMCFGFPEPNPFETNAPVAGQSCGNLGLAGADPDAPIPPVPTTPGAEEPGGAGGAAGVDVGADGGAPAGEDAGVVPAGGGSSGGCSARPGSSPAPWLTLLPLLALVGPRRRR